MNNACWFVHRILTAALGDMPFDHSQTKQDYINYRVVYFIQPDWLVRSACIAPALELCSSPFCWRKTTPAQLLTGSRCNIYLLCVLPGATSIIFRTLLFVWPNSEYRPSCMSLATNNACSAYDEPGWQGSVLPYHIGK